MARPFFFVPLAFLVAGCGGGGGTPAPDPNPGTGLRIEARSGGAVFDLANLLVGDTVELRIVGRNAAGAPASTPLTGGVSTAPASLAITGSTARAVAAGNGTLSVAYRGTTLTTAFRVVDPGTGTLLRGRVRADDGTVPTGVIVRFLDFRGTVVGTQTIGSDGTIRAIVPPSATDLDLEFPDTRFYEQFGFGDNDYSPSLCPGSAALPTLVAGGAVTLSDIVVYSRSSTSVPPPPPSCGG